MSESASITTSSPWRARVRRWLKPPRQLVLTTSGKFFVVLTLGVGFGAVNTGNNLLFLLLGMMLALMTASGILSEAVLRDLAPTRRLPSRIFANQNATGSYVVLNDKGFASLSVRIEDRKARVFAGPNVGATVGYRNHAWWKIWKKPPDENDAISTSYAIRIAGHETQALDARFTFPQRGRFVLSELSIVTQFPFSFFDKSRELDDAAEVVVYPQPESADDWVADVYSRFGDVHAGRAGRGDEFYGLRDYRDGEDHRAIHWKASAKRNQLVVRENEALKQQAVEIVIAHRMHRPPSPADLKRFEIGLEKTCGLLLALHERGFQVGLRSADQAVPATDDLREIDRMLNVLATVMLETGPPIEIPDDQLGRIAVGPAAALSQLSAESSLTLSFDEVDR